MRIKTQRPIRRTARVANRSSGSRDLLRNGGSPSETLKTAPSPVSARAGIVYRIEHTHPSMSADVFNQASRRKGDAPLALEGQAV